MPSGVSFSGTRNEGMQQAMRNIYAFNLLWIHKVKYQMLNSHSVLFSVFKSNEETILAYMHFSFLVRTPGSRKKRMDFTSYNYFDLWHSWNKLNRGFKKNVQLTLSYFKFGLRWQALKETRIPKFYNEERLNSYRRFLVLEPAVKSDKEKRVYIHNLIVQHTAILPAFFC